MTYVVKHCSKGGNNMRRKVISLVMAFVLLTCLCTATAQAANYATLKGATVDYQIGQYTPVAGDTGFSPYPLTSYATFNLDTYGLTSFFAENVGTTRYILTYVSISGDILNPYIRYRYEATTPAGSYASGYVLMRYFV